MNEYASQLRQLAVDLLPEGRVFAPRTPHTYAHLGSVATPPLLEQPDRSETRMIGFGNAYDPLVDGPDRGWAA